MAQRLLGALVVLFLVACSGDAELRPDPDPEHGERMTTPSRIRLDRLAPTPKSPSVPEPQPPDTTPPLVALIGPRTVGSAGATFTFTCDEPS